MKTDKSILLAFIFNLGFSVFEFFGGLFTGSVAIISDALHDLGDAATIGISYFFEKKSHRPPDENYTYGYARYSVLCSAASALVLAVGSVVVAARAVDRLFHPVPIHYDGMILLAVVGVAVNAGAAFFTRHGDSLNQKTVNLHMLEDVLGWVAVLVGAVIMRFTDLLFIDPIMSIAVAGYIFAHALKHIKAAANVLLQKAPDEISANALTKDLCALSGVREIHHLHLWSLDGYTHCATLHVVTDGDSQEVKREVRHAIHERGIHHVTVETESEATGFDEKTRYETHTRRHV